MFFLYEKSKELWGSTTMRGFDISKKMNSKCLPLESLDKNISGNIIICLKFSNYNNLIELSKKNKIVIDMVDCNEDILRQLSIFKNFNSGIFTSYAQLLKFRKYFKNPKDNMVIYHHWDPRLSDFKIDEFEAPRFSYFGVDSKCFLYKEIKEIDYYNVTESKDLIKNKNGINFEKTLSIYKNYNVHFVMKPLRHELLLQPMTKISNAAAIGCPVISLRNAQYEELLSKEYPYFCESLEKSSVTRVIEKIKKTFGKEEWHKAMNIMKDIKISTSLDILIKKYSNISLGLFDG